MLQQGTRTTVRAGAQGPYHAPAALPVLLPEPAGAPLHDLTAAGLRAPIGVPPIPAGPQEAQEATNLRVGMPQDPVPIEAREAVVHAVLGTEAHGAVLHGAQVSGGHQAVADPALGGRQVAVAAALAVPQVVAAVPVAGLVVVAAVVDEETRHAQNPQLNSINT